jgi:para-nitrobenzyl esterase
MRWQNSAGATGGMGGTEMSISRGARLASGAAMTLACLALAGAAIARPADGPRVQTTNGPVRGFIAEGIAQYLGIPYAAPPVGDLRWRPPQPAAAWQGERDATKFAPTCAQITELGVFAGPANANEDCLYLNVFTADPTARGKKLKPVLMWIHGGGLVDGESNDYDASWLVKKGMAGDTVVVTINYRLGLLGYFAHPALDAEGHNFANYGLMDQQAALQWIRANIEKFGGDPNNVTVGGQSAGSTSTAANVISPLAKGLFGRAIFESGPLLTVTPLSYAEQTGTNFGVAAGCPADASPQTAACLRSIAVPAILNLQGTPAANGPYVIGLIVDGTVLPVPGDVAWSTGQYTHMPIINGTVHDEGAFTVSINEYFYGPLTADQYTAKINAGFGGSAYIGGPAYPPGTAAAVLAQYPASAYPSPSLAWVAQSSDATACRMRHLSHLLAGQVPLYAYEFEDKNAPWYFPPLSFPHGAAHTIDIQFLFKNWHGGPLGIPGTLSPQEKQLSDRLLDDWTSFMYSGDPNLVGNKPWPKFTQAKQSYYAEDVPQDYLIPDAQLATDHNCAFWDQTLVY